METQSVHNGSRRSARFAAIQLLLAAAAGCAAPGNDAVDETQGAVTTNVSVVGHIAIGSGVAAPGITVNLAGGLNKTAVTDSNGNFLFQVPPGSYSLKPLKAGATFTPDVVNLNSLAADRIQDFTCSGTCAGGQVVVAAKELVITDPTVIGDPRAQNETDGPWSFRFLMEQMAPANTDPADFVEAWLSQFTTANGNTAVNGFPIDNRDKELLRDFWPKTPNGKVDLSKAPFRLLAIMNRIDLHATTNGEARFIFGAFDRNAAEGQEAGLTMSVIFEYGLPAADVNTHATLTRKSWASKFHALGAQSFGAGYGAALQAVTDLFTRRGTSPGKPGSSSINQVRTNEIVMGNGNPWQLREFHLDSALGLRISTTAATPADGAVSASNPANQILVSYINGSAALIHGGYASVPTTILGGQSTEFFSWTFDPPVNEASRHAFAGQTCNGCHNSETNGLNTGSFYHVAPNIDPGTDGTGRLSPFIKNFEIPRRAAFLQNVLDCSNSSCSVGGEPVFL
jgi:hypothetical protein